MLIQAHLLFLCHFLCKWWYIYLFKDISSKSITWMYKKEERSISKFSQSSKAGSGKWSVYFIMQDENLWSIHQKLSIKHLFFLSIFFACWHEMTRRKCSIWLYTTGQALNTGAKTGVPKLLSGSNCEVCTEPKKISCLYLSFIATYLIFCMQIFQTPRQDWNTKTFLVKSN